MTIARTRPPSTLHRLRDAARHTPDLSVVEAPPSTTPAGRYRAYTLKNLESMPQARLLSAEQVEAIRVVGSVLPFKTNNYVVGELIDWEDVPNDPMFVLNFPQREMLRPEHYECMRAALEFGENSPEAAAAAHEIRLALNPHPAGQLEHNVPEIYGQKLPGMQHKYRETVLFFPSNGQTCHAYCTFCFRWPQFVGEDSLKFAAREAGQLVDYLKAHREVTNVLITGGDPMVMSAKNLAMYIEPLLEAELPNLAGIRIGTKSLAYWPYRFLTDKDAGEVLALFRKVTARGLHLAIMAHFNHPRELETDAVRRAIEAVRATGAEIRTQSPIMRNINDSPGAWASMWRQQVQLGCIPYYMFLARDTGAQQYFRIPLVKAWEIYREAYSQVSGLARTVRGPSMSCDPGKVRVLGPVDVDGRKLIALNFLQGRDPEWVQRPFFAEYDEEATWLDELRPAFGAKRFFFEDEAELTAS